MEKNEFRVLKPRSNSTNIIRTLLRRMEWFRSSLPNFVVIIRGQKPYRPCRPNEVTTPEMITKIHDIVLNDPKVKVREIAEVVSTSTKHVVNILHTHLYMKMIFWLFLYLLAWILITVDAININCVLFERYDLPLSDYILFVSN